MKIITIKPRDDKFSNKSKLKENVIHAYIVKAFNYFAINKIVKILKYDELNEEMPKPITTK